MADGEMNSTPSWTKRDWLRKAEGEKPSDLIDAELLKSMSSVVLSSEREDKFECIRVISNAAVNEVLAMLLSRLISLASVDDVVRPSELGVLGVSKPSCDESQHNIEGDVATARRELSCPYERLQVANGGSSAIVDT